MHYFAEYGLFLAKTFTVVLAFCIIFAFASFMKLKAKTLQQGRVRVQNLSKKYQQLKKQLAEEIHSKKQLKTYLKQQKQAAKATSQETRHRLFVLRFHGDIKASAVEALREEITALLCIATSQDEVLLCLESHGGMVHAYGLAASQLQRIRDRHIPLTIVIDKVAASGGYMMACVGHKILAAPFAIIGSIGVIAQLPNFNRWLKKNLIDFEQVTAGEYKRTLTLFGENTDKDREKLKQDLEEIHSHFKQFIVHNRPQVNIQEVATGEHWLGEKALQLKLVDGLMTSDDYIMSATDQFDVYSIQYHSKKPLAERLGTFVHNLASWS